jgi:Holliday junction DNA helicase RuvA
MIASLRGTLSHREPAGIVIEVAGVGYLVEVPLGVFERLPSVGQDVALQTELVVREDAWSLYGFDSPVERAIFRRLLGASGVGARLALAILSTLGPDRAVRAVRERDLAALSTVPGIGRKKAERIALELADRFDDLPSVGAATGPTGSPSADAVRALVALGYQAAAAETAVRKIADAGTATDTAALLRRALAELTGN